MVNREWLETALAACGEAGRIQRRYFRSAGLGVDTKNDGSPVTAADREAEQAIRNVLQERTPEMGILGEEEGSQGPENRRWIVARRVEGPFADGGVQSPGHEDAHAMIRSGRCGAEIKAFGRGQR